MPPIVHSSILSQAAPTVTASAGAAGAVPVSPISPLIIGAVLAIIVGTIFVWAWAMRRPVPSMPLPSEDNTQADTEKTLLPFVYAAIGASDVVGAGAQDPMHDSWVSLLAGRMPAGTRFVRLGRGGITLNEANKVEVPAAVEAQPDLVTMWNCVNDAVRGVPLPLYLRDVGAALDTLTRDTGAHIILLNLPDVSLLFAADSARRALVQGGIQQWNAGIAGVVARYGDRVTLLDLFPLSDQVLAQPELISIDSFHPSTEGYRWLADTVWDVVEREGLLHKA